MPATSGGISQIFDLALNVQVKVPIPTDASLVDSVLLYNYSPYLVQVKTGVAVGWLGAWSVDRFITGQIAAVLCTPIQVVGQPTNIPVTTASLTACFILNDEAATQHQGVYPCTLLGRVGPVTATSVQVVGTQSEIDIDLVPPDATIHFKDTAGTNYQEAIIKGTHEAAENAMAITLHTQNPADTDIGNILVSPNNLTVNTASAAGKVAVMQFYDNRIDVNGELWSVAETWQSLALGNGWAQTAGYITQSYRKTPENMVEFRGTIHAGTIADNTQIATMPVGYRPTKNALIRPAVAPSGAGNVGSSRIFIVPAGGVYIYGMTGVTDLGLDGLRFSLDA